MRMATVFVLAGALLAGSGFGLVQQAPPKASVAVINGDRVLEGSNVGRNARQRLENEAKKWQERINAATQELQTLTRQRQEQALTLSEQALSRLTEQIEEKQVQIQRMNDDARRELQRLEQQVTVEVNNQLGPLVERFASERGLDLILDSARAQGLLYFNNALDLTDDFLQVVNAGGGQAQQNQQQ